MLMTPARGAWVCRNASDFLPCGGGCLAATILSHFQEPPMNRTTHLLARSALGAARQWARGIVGAMGQRSAGKPALI
jgi:hypothetical protein